jgi:lysophospholipase L1-like esterase
MKVIILNLLLLIGPLAHAATPHRPWQEDKYVPDMAGLETRVLHGRGLVPLKILPMGDSITQGYQSSDSNGYRLDLLNDLENGGYSVTYVGIA